jgi:hypothetical protein
MADVCLFISFHISFILPKFALCHCAPFVLPVNPPHQLYRHNQGVLYVLRFRDVLMHLNSCNLCVKLPTRLAYINL